MTFLKRVLAAGAIIVGFAGWAAAENVLRTAYDAITVTLDPHEQSSGATVQMSHMLFDPLIRWNTKHEFEPRLAKSWEQIDDTTMRFHLREGVTFHSGNPLTANDVKWTLDRLKQSNDFKAIFNHFIELVVIDDLTFDIKTDVPYPLILHNATVIFPMDSLFYTGTTDDGRDKAENQKNAGTFASTHVSGTGPFTVALWKKDDQIIYKRFPNYWDTDSKGNIDQVVETQIKRDLPRVAALLSGNANLMQPVPPNIHGDIEDYPGTELYRIEGKRNIAFQMNQDRVEAFKDPRVRLAINYAIDNKSIVKSIMRGIGTPAGQASPKGYLGHDEALVPRHDLQKAQQLMKEAGYENGFTITMMAPNNRYMNDEKIAQAVALMLSTINVKVDLTTMPKSEYWGKFDERAADMMMIGWHSDTSDSANFHEFLTACPNTETGLGRYNSGNYCNPKADELLQQANVEVDPEMRAILLRQIERILYEEAAFVPLHWQDHAIGTSAGLVNLEDILVGSHTIYLGDLIMEN